MTKQPIPFRMLATLAAAALLVAAGALVYILVDRALGAAGAAPGTESSVLGAALAGLVVAGIILLLIVGLVSRGISQALTELRAALIARARDEEAPLPTFAVRELSSVADAIDRVARRDAAREAEAKRESTEVRILLDAITDGILRLDSSGRILRANPAAVALLGLPDDPHGLNVSTQVRQADLRRVLERAATGTPVAAAEISLREKRLIVSARPLDTAHVNRGGAVVTFVDLTAVRRLESVRRDFVANVSHELKTPLTSIRGYAETLLNDDDLPPEMRRQFLEVVYKNADRLHHIVDDLLDLSRLESGGWRPEPRDFDALTVVEEVWSTCRHRAESRDIRFAPPAGPVHVHADPAGLRQVLANLLDNAIRYTPPGGAVRICTAPSDRGLSNGNGRLRPAVVFEVTDTGPGIPSDALPRIFERFYRVDPSRSRSDGGTGLGLSIVKHLVESMGGDVSVESEMGRGTTIRFRLPASS